MSLSVKSLTGASLEAALPDVARLRIEVFREWPYIYDGSYDYESTYLADFAGSDGSVLVVVTDGGRIVGASTATPMGGHAKAFAEPFISRGYDIRRIFYFGESVLLRAYRGRGFGHSFFDNRESHARAMGGFDTVTFCSVRRPMNHPLKPDGYKEVDGFWHKRGYKPVDGLVGSFSWLDIGENAETAKPMQYWMKAL